MSGAKQAATHHPETIEKVRKRGATITMGRQTKPEKQQSNKLTIGIEKRPRLDARGTRGQSSMPGGTGGQGSNWRT